MRIIVPAMRVAVAKKLSEKGMSQVEIAKRLGVAQAAISKYLNGNYSKKISVLAVSITKHKLEHRIVELALAGNTKALAHEFSSLALNRKIVCGVLSCRPSK